MGSGAGAGVQRARERACVSTWVCWVCAECPQSGHGEWGVCRVPDRGHATLEAGGTSTG